MPRGCSWDAVLMRVVCDLAQKSKDRTQVAALIIDPEHRNIAFGYNGFGPGVPDEEDVYDRRKDWFGYTKDDLSIHAEINALLNCNTRPVGWTMYVTHDPCVYCAPKIHAAGIARVVTLGRKTMTEGHHQSDRGIRLLQHLGVIVDHA